MNIPLVQVLYYIVGSITGVLGLGLVAVGGVAAYRQLTTSVKAREMQAIATLLAFTDQGEWRAIRRLFYRPGFKDGFAAVFASLAESEDHAKPLDTFLATLTAPESTTKATHDDLHGYVASLETVAMLVLYELAPNDLVTGYFGRIVEHHWELLGPYRDRVRKQYPEFLQHLEQWYKILARANTRGDSHLNVFERGVRPPREMRWLRQSLALAKWQGVARIHADTVGLSTVTPGTRGGRIPMKIVGASCFLAGAALVEALHLAIR